MVATELDVANLALGMLNIPPLTSLADPNRHAELISSVFADTRDELLREHAWNFAHVLEPLTEDAAIDASPYGFTYAYELPDDCLRIHKICAEGNYRKGYRFSILNVEDGSTPPVRVLRLFTDIQDAYARYTIRVEDVTLWDQLFVRAMATYLAFKISSLKGVPEIQNNMFQLYLVALA